MDAQRFDDLARLIGSGATRRRVLALLGGGIGSFLAGKLSGRAQCTNPESCLTDGECCEGFTCDPGSATCRDCVGEGEACTTDAECCDSFDAYGCDGGICQDRCTGFDCNCCPGSWCVAEGQECASIECTDDDDCPTRSTGCHNGWCVDYDWRVCEVTSDCDPGLECRNGFCYAPCAAQGETCSESVTCCGELTCVEGACAEGGCAGSGEACAASAECCGDLVCSSEDACIEECRAEGESPCSGSGSYPCCQGLKCVEDTCFAASECVVEGHACAADDDCCGDLVCTGGICQVRDDTSEPPDDDEVTQLPDTGVGAAGSGRGAFPWLGSLAAGVAALLAGKTLRKERDEVSQTGDEAS